MPWRRGLAGAWLVGAILGVLQPSQALAQDEQPEPAQHHFSGNLRLNHYSRSKDFAKQSDLTGLTAELTLESTLSTAWRSKLVWRGHQENIGQGRRGAQGEWVEAFALWRGETTDVKLGKQIVAWGRADGINPTDNLTPRNYRRALPYEEDQRSGTTAIKVDHYQDAQKTWTFYLAPDFSPGLIPLPTRSTRFHEQAPPNGPWPMALKFDQRSERLDWSLSYFHGFNAIPEFQSSALTPDVVNLHHPRITVYGADMAHNLGRYGWRAELARVIRSEPLSGAGLRSHWALVVGVDRNFDDDLNIGVQLVARRNSGEAPDAAGLSNPPWDALNAITFFQQGREKFGTTLRLDKKWLNGTLDTELLWVNFFDPGTSYWRPLLSYGLSDSVKLTAGAEVYRGLPDSYFGRNKPIETVFVEVKFMF